MTTTDVPPGWWQHACEKIHFPIACVARDSRFVWVNEAFERLIGYSVAELREKTWMDITLQKDVGGDHASVQAVVRGDIPSYTISKRYVHKFGSPVPVTLTVWRFPPNIGDVACFVVEAAPKTVNQQQLDEVRVSLEEAISALAAKVKPDSREGAVSVSVNETNTSGASDLQFKLLIGVVAGLCLVLMYVAYIVFGQPHHRPPVPVIP